LKRAEDVKEKIIHATVRLIADSEGDIASLSTRAIAASAGVGIGLINYHFQTKDNLIEICVERMIGKVIESFSPDVQALAPIERLKESSKTVMDFLVANPAVARISILSDSKNPKIGDNTMKSVSAAVIAFSDAGLPKKELHLLSFTLISVMQSMFLRRDHAKEVFGFDINEKKERDSALDRIIESIFGGIRQ